MWWLRRLIVLLCKVLLSERQHTTRKNTFGAAGRYRNDQWIDAIFDVSSLPLDHSPWSSPCAVQPLVPSCRILPVVRRMSYLPPAWFNNHNTTDTSPPTNNTYFVHTVIAMRFNHSHSIAVTGLSIFPQVFVAGSSVWQTDRQTRMSQLIHHRHHHRQPWAQHPLVSDAIVTIAAHRCLSRAAWLNSCS